MNRAHLAPTADAGLLLSLASTLPASAALARKARRVADRLARHPDARAHERAAALLAALLTATDTPEFADYPLDDLLDPDF